MVVMHATNRSAPPFSVVPVLVYADVRAAVEWLTRVFGFEERVQIGDHRAQLSFAGGALIVADDSQGRRTPPEGETTHSVLVRVDDVDAHHHAAAAAGAQIVSPPADHPYGERQYSARDLGAHLWAFTQSLADVRPEDWGGVTVREW
jgi:uncharacterized glyoxalase superfamily protein PhnB